MPRLSIDTRARFCVLALLAIAAVPVRAQRGAVASDSSLCSARAQAAGVDSLRTVGPASVADSTRHPVSVVIYAAASAREVRFNAQPQLHVRLCGSLDSVHVLDRRNLPSPVAVGTTYRNVYVAVEIFGRVSADCIKNEWLGGTARDSTRAGRTPADCAALTIQRAPSGGRSPSDSSLTLRRP